VGMRVLVSCRSYAGHFLPMLPLARALLEAGHDVGCASGHDIEALAQGHGLTFRRAGPGQMTAAERATLFSEVSSLSPAEIRPFFFRRVFAAHELPLRIEDLDAFVEQWKPDILVHEVAEFAGPLVASLRGLPYATHSFGVLLGEDIVAAAAEAARPHWQSRGLDPHPRAGLWRYLYLDVCPPTLQRGVPSGAPAVQQVRPGERTPRARSTGRPLVYITLGTVYNSDTATFRTILDGLAGEDVEVVVTVGPHGDQAALGQQPANVHIERFIPQAEILPTCSLVITNGGAGSTLGALTFGCPILFLPLGADQFVNAERVTIAGAGRTLLPTHRSANAVRKEVRRLLDERSFTHAAESEPFPVVGSPPVGGDTPRAGG
jgi:UDP:flavonoid glycosyltransferase YjiC (YdhE family)